MGIESILTLAVMPYVMDQQRKGANEAEDRLREAQDAAAAIRNSTTGTAKGSALRRSAANSTASATFGAAPLGSQSTAPVASRKLLGI